MSEIIPALDVTGGATAPVKAVPTQPEVIKDAPVLSPEEQKSKEDAAARFAQLSRREKMIRAKAREIETREAAIRERELLLSQPKEIDWREKLKQDPMGALTEAGMTYDDMVNQLLTQNPQDQSLKLIQNEMKAIREENAQLRKSIEDKETNSMQQALNQIKFDIKNMVTSSPDEFEALHASGDMGYDMVVRLIREQFDKDKTIMDMEEAARDVEEYLADRYLELAKLKKIQAKLTPTQQAAKGEVPNKINTAQAATKSANTLSHSMTPSSKAPLSAREKRERAILAFEGKLQG